MVGLNGWFVMSSISRQNLKEERSAQAGDSGSWWLEGATHRAVGLHFAGSNDPEYGLAIAMPQVLEALNIDIATEAGSAEAASARWAELVRV